MNGAAHISGIQVMLMENERREKLAKYFESFCDKYSGVEAVFGSNRAEITNGFLDETKEYDNLHEAVMNWEPNQALHITLEGKYILGQVKPFNECSNKIFDISALKYFN